jgi:hypothetical protein
MMKADASDRWWGEEDRDVAAAAFQPCGLCGIARRCRNASMVQGKRPGNRNTDTDFLVWGGDWKENWKEIVRMGENG